MRHRLLVPTLAVLALAGCGDEAEPGDVVAASEVAAPTQVVLIPTGKLAVTMSEPVDELPDAAQGSGGVAGGGRWVGVAWELRPGDRSGVAELGLERPPLPEPTLALVADGERYPLGPAYRVEVERAIAGTGPTARYVAVAGDPQDVAVAVTYDGVTQTIDPASTELDAGGADGLYSIVTASPACRGPATMRPPLEGTIAWCRVHQRALVPYVGGLGWAEPGRAWAVVDVSTGLVTDGPLPSWPRPDGDGDVGYVVTDATSTYTVAGRSPAATLRSVDGADEDLAEVERVLAFDVDADEPGTLRITQRMRLRPQDPDAGAPEVVDLVARQRAPLG